MNAVFDTNILIDYLNGEDAALRELSLYQSKFISVITYMEVLVGAVNSQEEVVIRSFLASFELKQLTANIAERVIKIRKAHRMKIPDAIVYATAQQEGCILVTRNTKDMKEDWPDVRVPYELKA